MKRVYEVKCNRRMDTFTFHKFFCIDKLLADVVPKIGGEHFYHSPGGCEYIYLAPPSCVVLIPFLKNAVVIGSNSIDNIENCVGRINQKLKDNSDYYGHRELTFSGFDFHETAQCTVDEKGDPVWWKKVKSQ